MITTHDNPDLERLISSLQRAECFDHPIKTFGVIETHISLVLLTGIFAYKFKKSVDLGFLDFCTQEKRKFYLDEELRLNKRLAPQLYLEVRPVTGTVDNPSLKRTDDPVLEYALKMRQFNPEDQLDRRLEKGELLPQHIHQLAQVIADFHLSLKPADTTTVFGDPEQISKPVRENFVEIRPSENETDLLDMLALLKTWSIDQLDKLRPRFVQRKQLGFIRECHGDMHLGNMVLVKGEVVIFDCIEFNEAFRWIDVFNEIAFVLMDLDYHNRPELANRLLNLYLEKTGDYSGIHVLNFYLAYRALVRAKVADIQRRQNPDVKKQKQLSGSVIAHVSLANRYRQSKRQPRLIICHGFSGSGKTRYSLELAIQSGAIRIRSDTERKRLFGLKTQDRTGNDPGKKIYSEHASRITYDYLAKLARDIIVAGFPIIVDATFLSADRRQQFRKVASELSVPFQILDFTAPEDVLKKRITERNILNKDASDADLDVLESQLKYHDPLEANEMPFVLSIDTTQTIEIKRLIQQLDSKM